MRQEEGLDLGHGLSERRRPEALGNRLALEQSEVLRERRELVLEGPAVVPVARLARARAVELHADAVRDALAPHALGRLRHVDHPPGPEGLRAFAPGARPHQVVRDVREVRRLDQPGVADRRARRRREERARARARRAPDRARRATNPRRARRRTSQHPRREEEAPRPPHPPRWAKRGPPSRGDEPPPAPGPGDRRATPRARDREARDRRSKRDDADCCPPDLTLGE